MFANELRKENIEYIFLSKFDAFFIAFLLDLVKVNPLPTHYICYDCNKVIFVDSLPFMWTQADIDLGLIPLDVDYSEDISTENNPDEDIKTDRLFECLDEIICEVQPTLTEEQISYFEQNNNITLPVQYLSSQG